MLGNARPEKSFLALPESVSEARQFVTDVLAASDVDCDDAALLTSEVASNAVRHANSDFRLRIHPGERAVRIEVINDAPEVLLIMRKPSVHGGYGLQILDRLAESWGVESTSEEKVVWFELGRRSADDAVPPPRPRV
jgi:anti-sigma regulatory factor (Ser/Thr protein kinase)